MNHLLLFLGEGQSFDPDEVNSILESMPGVREVRRRTGPETEIEVDFFDENGSSLIRLNGSSDAIAASWHGRSALNAALLIQERFDRPLRAIDMNYAFDVVLQDFSSVEELEAAISQ